MSGGLFDITGKVVLVTGGAQGLGRMIAEGYVRAGARVYVTSRKPDIVAQAAEDMSASGSCVGIAADLSTPEAAVALAADIAAREDRLHVVVNNAGKTWGAPIDAFPDKAWAGVMAVNVQTPFTLVRELLPILARSGTAADPARVINIGSVAGVATERGLNAFSYSASKAAIHHLSKVLAAEIAERHIAVNTVVPGYFPTSMTAHISAADEEKSKLEARIPLGRMGLASDIAGICVFLASPAAAYITGAEIPVDGGLSGCR